jgi:hypothetical protein
MGLWFGLASATLEFWVRFPNERDHGKQAHRVLKYRGSQFPGIVAAPVHAIHTLPFFFPSFFHTISLSPAFASA